jgi:hypothetical protein
MQQQRGAFADLRCSAATANVRIVAPPFAPKSTLVGQDELPANYYFIWYTIYDDFFNCQPESVKDQLL